MQWAERQPGSTGSAKGSLPHGRVREAGGRVRAFGRGLRTDDALPAARRTFKGGWLSSDRALPPPVPSILADVIVPVFVLVALGWAAAASGYLSRETGDGLAAFVFGVAVPVLLARTVVTVALPGWEALALYGAYFGGVATVWVLAWIVADAIFRRGPRAAVIAGVGAGFSNIVLVGIPLTDLAFGRAGLDVLFLIIAVHLPIMVTTATVLMEVAMRMDGTQTGPLRWGAMGKRLGLNYARNPLIVGVAAGTAWRIFGLPFDGTMERIADLLAGVAGPTALFALGMSLVKYGIRGQVGPGAMLAVLSVAVMPGVVFALATALDLPRLWLQVAVLAAAMPTGVNAYLFASYFKVAQGIATNTIVIATALSLVTVPLWLAAVA